MEPPFEACIDANAAIDLFDPRDGDFSALRVLKQFHALDMRLVLPELALGQMMVGSATRGHACFRNIVEYARCAGPDWFSVGAPLYFIRVEELAGRNHDGLGRSPRFTGERLAETLAFAEDPANFASWHRQFVIDSLENVASDVFEQMDRAARELARSGAVSEYFRADATMQERASWLKVAVPQLPLQIEKGALVILESVVKDAAARTLIGKEPKRYPFLVALGLACSLNIVGAATNMEGHHEYDFLKIEGDAWTDARILASAAYADVFITNDRRLKKRAELISSWGYFKPQAFTWAELVARRI